MWQGVCIWRGYGEECVYGEGGAKRRQRSGIHMCQSVTHASLTRALMYKNNLPKHGLSFPHNLSLSLSLSPFLSLVLSLSLFPPPLPPPRLPPPASIPLRTHKRSSGPSFAREIATGLATAVVVASHSDAFANQVTFVHCNTLQHTATHCIAVQHAGKSARLSSALAFLWSRCYGKAVRWVRVCGGCAIRHCGGCAYHIHDSVA